MKRRVSRRLARANRGMVRNAAKARSKKEENYHLAIIGLTAIIIFLLASIAMKFSIRTTGYATAPAAENNYMEVRSYTTEVYNCQPYSDNFDPYASGYVIHSGDTVSRDSCIDSSTLLEYSCGSVNTLKSDMILCKYGCVEGGYCG